MNTKESIPKNVKFSIVENVEESEVTEVNRETEGGMEFGDLELLDPNEISQNGPREEEKV